MLHSPGYRRRYADFLKSDFPCVPVTNCGALFASLAPLGKRLTALHLMEVDDGEAPTFPVEGNNCVEKVRYAPPQKTPRIMAKIDKTIEAYGGWPLVQEDYLRGLYQTMSEEWNSPEDEEAWLDL